MMAGGGGGSRARVAFLPETGWLTNDSPGMYNFNRVRLGLLVAGKVCVGAGLLVLHHAYAGLCAAAAEYSLCCGVMWILSASCSILNYLWLRDRAHGDEYTSPLDGDGRWFVRVTYVALAVLGTGTTLVAIATVFDAAVLFCVLNVRNVCFDVTTNKANAGLLTLVFPLLLALCAVIIMLGVWIATLRKECMPEHTEESWSLLSSFSPNSSSRGSAGGQKQAWRRYSLFLLVWAGVIAGIAYLMGMLLGGWPPVGPWECPAPAITSCASLPTPSAPVPKGSRSYTLALWHEGYPIATKGNDASAFAAYVSAMVSFCKQWSFDRCFLQIYNPASTSTAKYTVFSPSSVARNFADPLKAAAIEVGFVAYGRPKDTNWNRDDPLGDIATYIQQVEAASATGATVAALAFDHEDLGTLSATFSKQIQALKARKAMSENLEVGYAGGVSLFSLDPSLEPGVGAVYPELYWYGELAPHFHSYGTYDCSEDCVDAMPCFSPPCTSTVYRKYINDASGFISNVVSAGLAALGLEQYVLKSSKPRTTRKIWTLFSIEHLSGCCPERVYGPADVCGTFDGLATWDMAKVLGMFEAYAAKYGFSPSSPMPIAMYEWQFVPPHFIDTSLSSSPTLVDATSTALPWKCNGT